MKNEEFLNEVGRLFVESCMDIKNILNIITYSVQIQVVYLYGFV